MGEPAELHAVDGALDGAALAVAQDDDQLRSGQPGREFSTANNIVLGNITGNAGAEDVANALVEYQLRWHAGIDAAQHYCKGKLPACGRPDLAEEVAVAHVLRQEPLISCFELLQGIIGAQGRLPLARQCGASISRESLVENGRGSGQGCGAANVSS